MRKTYTCALAKCDHHEIAKAIAHVIQKARAVEQCGDEPSRLLAQKGPSGDPLIHTVVDGKVLRGTLKHGREDQPPVHLLAFYECESGIVLDHFCVGSKKNEQSACIAILHPLLVKGRILAWRCDLAVVESGVRLCMSMMGIISSRLKRTIRPAVSICVLTPTYNWLILVFGEALKTTDLFGMLLQKDVAGGGKQCRTRHCFPYQKDWK